MPLYIYKCGYCGDEQEHLQKDSDPAPEHCNQIMLRIPASASFEFTTKAGNRLSFSGAHGPVTKGSKKPAEIGGSLGGKRKRATLGGKRYA